MTVILYFFYVIAFSLIYFFLNHLLILSHSLSLRLVATYVLFKYFQWFGFDYLSYIDLRLLCSYIIMDFSHSFLSLIVIPP